MKVPGGIQAFWALFQLHVFLFLSHATPTFSRSNGCPFHPDRLLSAFQNPLTAVNGIVNSKAPPTLPRISSVPANSWQPASIVRQTVTQSLAPRFSSTVDQTELDTAAEKKAKRDKRLAQSSKPLDVHVIGLSHHNADVSVREKLAVPEADWNTVSAQLVAMEGIDEAAILSTCNRFEVYVGAHEAHEAIRDTILFLSERSGLPQSELRKNLFILSGEDATKHVLRVSGGLDSLVVGEGQILSQVRQCYLHGIEEDGSAGKVTSRMLNVAVSAGKRVRAETAISRGAVSISSAAVEFSNMRAPKDLNKDFLDSKLCIVGAGKMSRLLVTHMSSFGVKEVTLVNRNLDNAQALADEYPDVKFNIRPMTEMWDAVMESDIAYASTAATECIITKEGLLQRQPTKPLMLVDISVPRNVEQQCEEVESVFSYNVDNLKSVVARNTAMRRKEVLEAEDLLEEELQKFLGWQQSLQAIPTISSLQEKAEQMRAAEFGKATKKLSDLSKKELQIVDKMTKGLVNKLLHGPMTSLRSSEGPEETRSTLAAVKAMFKLGNL
uniref:Glutamyl-tRNA reductase n=1 Tax=Fibrocapsa japonica TaxID=94617 RepID=A0A7S2V0V0_9STRA|mmetsp:Transcript_23649/g.34396  ORF Transcript_23649/g.34396 Transcript_23649/m.34396 type:complete len:552 (+) Transcript_23649:100-1755(+)|eukprot:CAMPEP_0113937266 /NCGR_PEP_ID=MMETSP1339-20121228/3918_1 /TAXON_ID=94617 /ORGANISM="Fibrocapsa japonica" /LENGTH=551 /DNA_ID=CAMNT_0000939963 /DNA_START=99 /DNA_END=1754 /DNA_ORIENTATION=- /assembly_acc=CAM_ASM_000762